MAIAGRTSWKGHLKISLVTIPVALVNAVTQTSKISLNRLHRDCGARLKQQNRCPEHGEVVAEDIVMGYEHEKGRYVVVDDDDLSALKLETTKVIEITQFSPAEEIDAAYLDAPYWIAADGKVAVEAFAAFRDAMKDTGQVGIGRVVLSGKEKAIVLRPLGRGLAMSTLHSPRELRRPDAYFDDIPTELANDEEAALSKLLVKRLSKPFDLSKHEDRYQEALAKLIQAKLAGVAPPVIEEPSYVGVPNLMDALRRSLDAEGAAPEAVANDTAEPAPAPPKAKKAAKVPDKAPPAEEPRAAKKGERKRKAG